jgi:hypothetical protein
MAYTSSDLTFLTNEVGNTLQDRFAVLLKKDTHQFDCLVGYFFVSGFGLPGNLYQRDC